MHKIGRVPGGLLYTLKNYWSICWENCYTGEENNIRWN